MGKFLQSVSAATGVLLTLLYGYSSSALAADPQQIDLARANGARWLLLHQNGDGSWGGTGDGRVIATSAALDALKSIGISGGPYQRGLSWLANAQPRSNDALSRQIATLASGGANVEELLNLLHATATDFYFFVADWTNDGTYNPTPITGWGSYFNSNPNFVDSALGLKALAAIYNHTLYPITEFSWYERTLNPLIILRDYQHSTDHVWARKRLLCSIDISGQPATCTEDEGDILSTSVVITSLQDYESTLTPSYFGAGQIDFDTATDWLIAKQKTDSSFGGQAGDPTGTQLETAVVLRAIADERGALHASVVSGWDYLIAEQNPDGSWEGDAFLTGVVIQAGEDLQLPDTDGDGFPDDIEMLMGMSPSTPDGRTFATGNGFGVIGDTVADHILVTLLGDDVNFQLPAGSGTGPWQYQILAGSLPLGLVLAGNSGLITGQAAQTGEFNFTYRVEGQDVEEYVVHIEIKPNTSGPADGDINLDGVVDTADVLVLQHALAGMTTLTPIQELHADVAPLVNGMPAPNGEVNPGDLLIIIRKAMGLVVF